MNHSFLNIIVLAALLAVSQVLAAQTTLSLEQVIELALEHDPRIDEKEAFVRQAQGMLAEAEGSGGVRYSVDTYLALTTGIDGGFYNDGDVSCATNCEPRDDAYTFNDGISLWTGLTFSIIKPLLTFGRLESYQDAAQQNILVKQQDVELQRAAIRLDVVRAYYGYLTARDSRLLLEGTRKRLEAAMELVGEWLEEGKGSVSQSDKYALESGMGLIDSYLAEASGLETIAMAGLKVLTGLNSNNIQFEDKRLNPMALPTRSLQEWTQLAVKNRAEFKQVEAGLAARRALVEASRSESKPIVFAGVAGTMAYAPGRDTLDNPHVYDFFNHIAMSPLVGMRWEWEQGAQPARVAQAQAELDALIHTASFARNGIPFQVQEQYVLMHSKFKSTQSMRSSARAGRRWMISAYADFEAGLEDADKILTAMQVYVLAYAEYLKTVNDYNNHVFKLQSVSGVFE
ncbi:MAG: TolC family protein [Gammaproteobacteria bacterium]|nr:TolC family protein [Gammaproteobacteria bacterium]